MFPTLIDGPAGEPVSLSEMKTWLRLDGDDEDDLVMALVTAARLTIEASTRRFMMAQTWRLTLDGWPPGGTLRLPLAPVRHLVAARVWTGEGVSVAVPPGSLRLRAGDDPATLRVAGPVPLPGVADGGIEIDLSVGFGATAAQVPAPLRQAVRVLATRWFENRGDGIDPQAQDLPRDILVLTAPYRAARLA